MKENSFLCSPLRITQAGFMQTDLKYLQLNNLFIYKTRSNLSKHKITKQTPAQVGWDKKRQVLATLALSA